MYLLVQSLFDEVPWLKPALAWCLGVLLILLFLLLFAVPAYYWLFPFARRVRGEFREYLERLRNRHSEARAAREASFENLADDCRKQWSLRQLDMIRNALLEGILEPLLKSLKRLEKTLRAISRDFGGIQKMLARLGLSLVKPSEPKFPELPSAESLQSATGALRFARGKFGLASVCLLILIAFNTSMLGQILRDLGFIPTSLMVLGIPLYVIVAVGLTILEASVGVLHAFLKPEPEDSGKFHFERVVAILLYLVIAYMEGHFYSQVAPQRDALVEFPIPMKQGNLYFLWGFTIITVLFMFGSMWCDALIALWRGNALTETKRTLHKLRDEHDAYLEIVKQTTVGIDKGKVRAEEAGRLLSSNDLTAENLSSAIKQVCGQIEQIREQPPEWARVDEKELGIADVHHLAGQAGVWIIVTLVAAALLIYTGFEMIWYLAGGLPPALYLVPGAVQVLVFFGSGFIFRAGEVVVGNIGSRRISVKAPHLSRVLSGVLVATAAVSYLYIVLRLDIPSYQSVFWLFNLLLGLVLAAAAYHLHPLLTVGRLWLRRIWNRTARATEWLYLLVLRFVGTLLTVLEYVLCLVAAPIFALRRQPIRFGAATAKPGTD